jgi:hypothetical protein
VAASPSWRNTATIGVQYCWCGVRHNLEWLFHANQRAVLERARDPLSARHTAISASWGRTEGEAGREASGWGRSAAVAREGRERVEAKW